MVSGMGSCTIDGLYHKGLWSIQGHPTPRPTAQDPEPSMSPKSISTAKPREAVARAAVIATARATSTQGLSPGRSGNVSCRWLDGMLITPSGMAYDELVAKDIVFVDQAGRAPIAARKPSSEWRFHLAAYAARPDCHAVVHTHSHNATVLACARLSIPAFHYMVAAGGGVDIPCVPYATFGTEELSTHVVAGLTDRNACLMANHGQIAIGESLASALELAAIVEELADQYAKVMMLGRLHILDADEMARVIEKFKNYGQRAQR
jgi:L-fuculose-phosphate aldolase